MASKVISVGNITWGGTGKTPLVELLARRLINDGRRVAILTRGYGRSAVAARSKTYTAGVSGMGDEAYLLLRKLPGVAVIVNSNRLAAARQAQQLYKSDTLILDDGFQQWGVEKDIDIVTIDASNPFGNGHMIPAGILREPPSALRRADIFVLTNADSATNIEALKSRIAAIKPEGLIVLARHAPCGMYMLSDPSKDCSLKLVRGIPVALVSAIGNPGSFRRTVEGLKISVEEEFIFPDHHRYSISDIASISKACLKKGIKAIITTEKDAVKIAPLSAAIIGPDMFVLKISLEIIEHEELFYSRLRSIYSP